MRNMMEGTQTLNVEGDVFPAVVKRNELTSEEEKALKSVESDTIVIEKVKGVTEPRPPSPATSSLYEAGGVMRVVDLSLIVATAPLLNPLPVGAMETWPTSPRGVPLLWSSAMRTLGVVMREGGQHQQPEAFDDKISELGMTVKG